MVNKTQPFNELKELGSRPQKMFAPHPILHCAARLWLHASVIRWQHRFAVCVSDHPANPANEGVGGACSTEMSVVFQSSDRISISEASKTAPKNRFRECRNCHIFCPRQERKGTQFLAKAYVAFPDTVITGYPHTQLIGPSKSKWNRFAPLTICLCVRRISSLYN